VSATKADAETEQIAISSGSRCGRTTWHVLGTFRNAKTEKVRRAIAFRIGRHERHTGTKKKEGKMKRREERAVVHHRRHLSLPLPFLPILLCVSKCVYVWLYVSRCCRRPNETSHKRKQNKTRKAALNMVSYHLSFLLRFVRKRSHQDFSNSSQGRLTHPFPPRVAQSCMLITKNSPVKEQQRVLHPVHTHTHTHTRTSLTRGAFFLLRFFGVSPSASYGKDKGIAPLPRRVRNPNNHNIETKEPQH
jgi:hypothetical protein